MKKEVAAILIMFFNWGWANPLAIVIVATLVLNTCWRITKRAVHLLMEGLPNNIELRKIITTIKNVNVVKIISLYGKIFQRNDGKKQEFDEAIITFEIIYAMYRKLDYELIKIPKDHVCNRANFVLESIKSWGVSYALSARKLKKEQCQYCSFFILLNFSAPKFNFNF
ncbi:hypothetical protein COL05_09330 [Bacillus sp. AFS059628]|uniref:hypothetical protein n=1 Tax=Bacillus sp. AFS059628 TaxID=2033508 RepID=UPI000BF55BB8|nr:hypothetical protein [Bacillus sp. AFS059628]PFV82888.1 hypothetical protein COL05_09330 [Bacillus sp. AFS059628]